jgi:hypothetical protein
MARQATEGEVGFGGELARIAGVVPDPSDDALLRPVDVAAWLHVEEDWVAQSIENDGLPVMGFTSAGEPILLAGEVRAWLRRPDPHGDET